MSKETKLELAAGLLATALEEDREGRESFKNVLALTIQDQLDKRVGSTEGTVVLSSKDIVEVAYAAADDFVITLENQND